MTPTILQRFETVVAGLGFRLNDSRHAFEDEPEGGSDGTFRVEETTATTLTEMFGISQMFRVSALAVQLRYFRGGGDMGGGSRKNVVMRALDDMLAIADACEDDRTYDSETTGIRVVRFQGFSRTADLERSEIWSARFDVEWESAVLA